MIDTFIVSIGMLFGIMFVAIGSVALMSPDKYVRFHRRHFDVPFWARDWYDPQVIAESRDMRNQWRLMGVGFVIGGTIFVVAAGRSLLSLLFRSN